MSADDVSDKLTKTTLIVWHDAAWTDVDTLVHDVDRMEGVEFTVVAEKGDSAATYDQERGCFVIPAEEIPAQTTEEN